jgi:hypothetical protein
LFALNLSNNFNTNLKVKKSFQKITIATVVIVISLFFACKKTDVAVSNYLPQDVNESCTVSPTEFDSWFATGKVSENGLVKPANSVTFPHNNNCDFYKWSEQMFLWVTSPSSGAYGSGGTVMESPEFYTVTPENNGQRELISHEKGKPLRMSSHITQNGPNRLPIIFDKKGQMYEVETIAEETTDKMLVLNSTGKKTEFDHLKANASGGISFFDKKGIEIRKVKPIFKKNYKTKFMLQEFKLGKQSVFLDSDGNRIDTETGQATQDGLMTVNGSLVYYISMVNDVYAYFLTGAKDGKLNGSQFPTTITGRDSIVAYAKAQGQTLKNPDALAIELKMSWVEASSIKDLSNYITIDAIIPTYDTSNPKKWTPNSERTAKLALIGVHVVGSVAGHPEMIWATFEHLKNTPNAAYTYVNKDNKIDTVQQDGGNDWLLNNDVKDTVVNVSHIRVKSGNLVGNDSVKNTKDTLKFNVSASNTLRTKPWGVAPTGVPNQRNKNAAESNSEIISINNSVINKLLGNDVRKNYILIGATWTEDRIGPNGRSYSATDTTKGVAIGTSQLANSTMETYIQHGKDFNEKGSCFFCHSGNNGYAPSDLSHIYAKLNPLVFKTK